ncbi:PLP-dependent aminotransferase family protein [Hymenobacter sp. BT664]|uniref:PLP-dependent aminotransferase family protein n=1 Tax=Hymenobacter montanus TaxID=2771359 RepID=A0A927GIE6_9BACT|nr:PLP-dependent aminotransferase family protein [Hymenobacter montanus]MBD2767290.1 PLP-dependent aminotransferase family protein [Hymenobacter montanus]
MPSSEKEPLYVRLSRTLQQFIEQGVWQPGERMPSLRQLSREHRVSLSTAFQTYCTLENAGVLEARPRSGYFVRPARPVLAAPLAAPSATTATPVRISRRLAEVLDGAAGSFGPFAAAVPALELLPVAALHKATGRVLRTAGRTSLGYEQAAGNVGLRRHIARQAPRWGGNLTADDLVITSGCLEALYLCLRAVTRPGDTVAVETPTYYGLLQTLENLGLHALEIATDPATGVDLIELEAAFERQQVAACLFVPTFNNPLGSCMPEAHKQVLVELVTHWQIPLIEDDVYGELYFGPARPRACKAYDRDGWVLLCASFSKQLAPGYRVGWAAPGRFRDQVERLKAMHNLATATLPQLALSEYLAHGRYDHHLRQLRQAFAQQVQQTTQAIQRYFPADTRVTQPAGGFVLWIELPASGDAVSLHEQALQHRIGFVPGPLFSAQARYDSCLRLTCGQPWSAGLEANLATLGRLAGLVEPTAR